MKIYILLIMPFVVISCKKSENISKKYNPIVSEKMITTVVNWENLKLLKNINLNSLIAPNYRRDEKANPELNDFFKNISKENKKLKLQWAYGSGHIFKDQRVTLIRYYLKSDAIDMFGEKLITLGSDGSYYIIPSEYWRINISSQTPIDAESFFGEKTNVEVKRND